LKDINCPLMGIKRLPDREAIQRALNACAARHAGINAAAVDAGSGRPGLYGRRNENRASVGEGGRSDPHRVMLRAWFPEFRVVPQAWLFTLCEVARGGGTSSLAHMSGRPGPYG